MLKTWEAVQKILNKEGKENFIVKQLIINMKKIFHITFLLIVSQLTSQQTPASLSEESILFIGATAHIGNGTIIENSAIGIRNGKITEVTTKNLAEGEYGISPGQACVFYKKDSNGDKLLGGGWITN